MRFLKKQNIVNENIQNELDIPKPILELHDIFKSAGKKLFLVGGAVRDFVTGETPKDFDLATDATPDEMKNILKDYRINLQGEKFGVIVVYGLEGLSEGVEIATFREDIGKGKETSVKVGSTIEMDVNRRDISFNGLFYDLDKKEIIDLVGGVKDLEDKVIRMIGNPVDRIEEDKLRILRLFRFSSRYESVIDINTINAIKNNNKLTDISQERIWDEFTKAFKQAKSFRTYLDFISEFDMWSQIFNGAVVTVDGYVETDVLEICLAQLFRDNDADKISANMVKRFDIPAKIANKVNYLMKLKGLTPENVYDFDKGRKRFHITDDVISEWFDINNMNSKVYKAFITFEPSVSSSDVIRDLGIETNPKGNPKNAKDGIRLGAEIKNRVIQQFKSSIVWN